MFKGVGSVQKLITNATKVGELGAWGYWVTREWKKMSRVALLLLFVLPGIRFECFIIFIIKCRIVFWVSGAPLLLF